MKKTVIHILLIILVSLVSAPVVQGFEGAADELSLIIGQQHVLDAADIEVSQRAPEASWKSRFPGTGGNW